MSMQTEFVTLVTGITAGRVYPMGAASSPVAPYITYSRVSAIEQTTLDTNGGTGNASNTRLQIDVWATTYGEAQSIAGTIKTALKGWSVENVILGEQDMHEPDTGLHRVLIDCSVWHL